MPTDMKRVATSTHSSLAMSSHAAQTPTDFIQVATDTTVSLNLRIIIIIIITPKLRYARYKDEVSLHS